MLSSHSIIHRLRGISGANHPRTTVRNCVQSRTCVTRPGVEPTGQCESEPGNRSVRTSGKPVTVDNLTFLDSVRPNRPFSGSDDRRDPSHKTSISYLFATSRSQSQILKLLRPVEWASVQTLASLTDLSKESVLGQLRQLESEGKVPLGTKPVPPELRTVAWITPDADPKRSRFAIHEAEYEQQSPAAT